MLRRWLLRLRQPDRLDVPEVRDFMRGQGGLPADYATRAPGEVAADFLTQAIERLRSGDGRPARDNRPYLVLRTCFIEGLKLTTAATRLGMSQRQLSRERSRAIGLLLKQVTRASLRDGEAPQAGPAVSERPTDHRLVDDALKQVPVPAILDFLARPTERKAVTDALGQHSLVHVHGPPGIGKTCLIADIAAEAQRTRLVLWHRFRPRINDTLGSLLFELGEYLRAQERPTLAAQVAAGMPTPDLGLLSRLALKELAEVPLLMVLDDYQVVDADDALPGFLAETATRCPRMRIITVGRHRPAGSDGAGSVSVPPLSRRETEALFAKLAVPVSSALGQTLHRWTGGTPQLVRLTAAWLKNATTDEVARGTASLEDLDEVQEFLLNSITELLGTEDRSVLAAASIFRDRFTDDSLAHVSERTRGHVQDSSRRLVRYYVATRSRSGDVAFLHGSVRNYVHSRLTALEHRVLHERAADWYDRTGSAAEATYHREHAHTPDPQH
jgi:ATP/maltotriose-dependent transcriptional regulator MalT